MNKVTEIAPNIFKISTFIPEAGMQFSQFLIRDEEPMLYHTGLKGLFPIVQEAVSKIMNPADLRYIGFSHFEADECGALSEWQEIAPNAEAVCSIVAKMVNVDDAAAKRPARPLGDGEVLSTGEYSFKFIQTPHLPHAWDAGHLYEENSRTLLCSDLFHQNGDVEDLTESDIVGRFRETLVQMQQSPLGDYLPYTSTTGKNIQRLAALKPATIATMHGTTFKGDGEKALLDLGQAMKDFAEETGG